MTLSVFISAYDVNPYKGSESGMGWNFALNIAKHSDVTVVTRRNNEENIRKFMESGNFSKIKFVYFDLPPFILWLKMGHRFWVLYYVLWQLFVAIHFRDEIRKSHICHSLNFHSDILPSFMWIFNKNFVWGPINHHEKIPRNLFFPVSIKNIVLADFIWMLKLINWKINPLLWLTSFHSKVIFYGSDPVIERLITFKGTTLIKLSSVGIDPMFGSGETGDAGKLAYDVERRDFSIITVGRLISLKGFDLAIEGYARWVKLYGGSVSSRLVVVGDGPLRTPLKRLADACVLNEGRVEFVNWLDRSHLPRYYRSSDVFLFPSHEGAGMVVGEAMQFDLPVVCLADRGPHELAAAAAYPVTSLKREDCINAIADALQSVYLQDAKFRAKSSVIKEVLGYMDWGYKANLIANSYQRVVANEHN